MIEGPRSEPLFSASPANEDTLAEVLRAGIADQGPALLYSPGELERHLEERCPAADIGIAMLLVALEEQVPEALLGAYAEGDRPALIRRLEEQLHDRRDLDRHSAQWVVETWARALRVVAPATPRRSDAAVAGAAFDPFANAVSMPAGDAARREPIRASRKWQVVAGVVAAVAIAAVAIGIAMTRSANRTAPDRILDTLSARAPTTSPPAAITLPVPDLVVPATPPPAVPGPAPVAPEPVPVLVATKQPSSIVDIVIPADLVAGKRFALTIDYRAGDHRPVAIERRRVGDGATARSFVVTSLAKLKVIEPGKLRYPFDAPNGPSRRTLDFTLIDADGRRSEPMRIVLDIARAPPVRVQPVTCTRDSCGNVQSVREIDASGRGLMGPSPARAASRRYEILVRMDDRSVRTVTQARRVAVGARVHWTGGRLIAIARNPATSSAPQR